LHNTEEDKIKGMALLYSKDLIFGFGMVEASNQLWKMVSTSGSKF
jgi:hypothetical protein